MKRQTYGQGPERSGACGTHTLCPSSCVPVLPTKDSGYQARSASLVLAMDATLSSHLGIHSLSLLTFWSVTLVRVLLTQGGDCCGDGDFSLAGCLCLDYKIPSAFFVWLLPARPSQHIFFFTLKRKLIQAFQAASCSHSQKPPTPAVTSSVPESLCLIPAGSIIPPHLTMTLYP